MTTRPLDEFRIAARPEIEAWLRRLLDRQVRLQLSTPAGASLLTQLCSVDVEHHSLGFEVPPDPQALQQLQALLDSAELVAVAYLDNIRLEFELDALVLVQGAALSTLRTPWPAELYRFQRRQAFRVEPLGHSYPRVLVQHPNQPDMALRLRVLDLSVSGLALLLPADVPPLQAGLSLSAARIELDGDVHFETALRLQHVGPCSPDAQGLSHGLRLGCAFGTLPSGAERALQLYIDQTQKRQRLLKKP